jgi:hypothetical protein
MNKYLFLQLNKFQHHHKKYNKQKHQLKKIKYLHLLPRKFLKK